MKRIVILISGRGSNMEAIIRAIQEGKLPETQIAAVISDRAKAIGLQTAAASGIATKTLEYAAYASRENFDAALANAIEACQPDLVLLAGFMRILTEGFIQRFHGRLLNIHPSLLPAFPGLHTHRRALESGTRLHGCTVHFVTPALDCGPVILQAAVPILDQDDEKSLAARVLAQEHIIYPCAVRWFLEGRLQIEGARVKVKGKAKEETLLSPEFLPEMA